METLQHQLMRGDDGESLLTGVRSVRSPETELTGRQAPLVRDLAALEPDDAVARE